MDSIKTSPNTSSRLIVTKVPPEVYTDLEAKVCTIPHPIFLQSIFEQVFRTYDDSCEFIYLPSFRRVLVSTAYLVNL